MIKIIRLPGGWWHVRGRGPCNWAQPPEWPCSEAMLRAHAFPEAGEAFLREAIRAARVEARRQAPDGKEGSPEWHRREREAEELIAHLRDKPGAKEDDRG